MSAQLQQFFKICDPEGTQSVDVDAFRDLCSRFNIAAHDADVIFEDLDHDHDGRISFADFSRGFSDFLLSSGSKDPDSDPNRGQLMDSGDSNKEDTTKYHVWTALTAEAERVGKKNSDEGKLKWLLGELQMSEQRHLVPYLETAVEELLGNLQQLQEEKSQLEGSWMREKQEHERHLKRMEEEMDHQVKETEMRLRLKAQTEMEDERKSLQCKMDVEMDNLQAHLVLFEKVNSWLQTHPSDNQDIRLDEVRNKLDDAVHENRQLRMSLLDTQTSIALMRSELLQLRTLYEEKCRELSSEREKILEVLHEQDHLSRQLNLLHDANRRLQDTNDALRNTTDVPNITSKRIPCGPSHRAKSGSIVGDYLDLGFSCGHPDRFLEHDDSADDEEEEEEGPVEEDKGPTLRRAISMDAHFPYQKRVKNSKGRIVRRLLNQSDSGVSTSRDPQELDEGAGSTPKSDLSLTSPEEESSMSLTVSEPKQPIRPVSLPTTPHDKRQLEEPPPMSKSSREERTNPKTSFEVRTMKESSSEGNLLEADGFPKKRISDIIKQLGIKDSPVSWNRSLSPKSPKSPDPTTPDKLKTSNEGIQPSPRIPPTPLPRITKMSKTELLKEEEREKKIHCLTQNGDLKDSGVLDEKQTITDGTTFENHPELHDDDIVFVSEDEEDDEEEYEPNGVAEETFKVIFVGDAGVGKSSFALRISKGVFVRHMSSTLGVDFLMRTIRVDGRNVAVQLWDTAGQERFRSITKSYFRKADGVMLLYDCTCEQSFLNVRQWVEDVDNVTSQRIPLMIVGNKIDLREIVQGSGRRCVTTAEGQKLAKDCDTTFMEASAKEGSNVLQAMANLVRSMSTQQELQISASTMHLSDMRQKKSSGCCGK